MPETLIENVQEVLIGSVPPVRLMTFVPGTAAMTPLPQDPACPFGVAITRPAGSVSLTATPLSAAVVFTLLMLNVSEVVPFSGILDAPNAVPMVGGPTTIRLMFEVLPLPPSVEVTATLLFLIPPVLPVTFREIVQEAPGASVAADKVTDDDPGTAEVVPPHVLLKAFGVDITNPAASVSVNAIPVSEIVLPAGAVMVTVSDVKFVVEMLGAPNDETMLGGAATVKVEAAVLPAPPFDDPTLLVVFG
jgi:hypothetical protein